MPLEEKGNARLVQRVDAPNSMKGVLRGVTPSCMQAQPSCVYDNTLPIATKALRKAKRVDSILRQTDKALGGAIVGAPQPGVHTYALRRPLLPRSKFSKYGGSAGLLSPASGNVAMALHYVCVRPALTPGCGGRNSTHHLEYGMLQ